MKKEDTILITGGSGLIGTALAERLRRSGFTNVVAMSSKDCDLANMQQTLSYFEKIKPHYVFHTAAHVYGIMGNIKNKGLSFLKNLLINTHVIEGCRIQGVKKVVALGSGCVYPFPSPGLPLKEDMVWLGEPHESENSYAHAKRAMLAQLNAYREDYGLSFAFVISGNLYGPNDKFDPEFGHVTPSLIRKFYEAKRTGGRVTVWGNGSARRDFMYVADVSEALVRIMDSVEGAVNMGSGRVDSIKTIVDILTEHTQLAGRVDWDTSKPNGQDYREYDLSILANTGFLAKFGLEVGIPETYDWYAANADNARK